MQPESILYQLFSNHQLHMLDTYQILFYHFYHSKENYMKAYCFNQVHLKKLQDLGGSSVGGVILEMTKDFITVILPKGLRFLDQAISTFFISFSLFSKLIVTISSTSVENTTPRTVNVTGFQSRLISGINLNFEFLRDPIHTALILSSNH